MTDSLRFLARLTGISMLLSPVAKAQQPVIVARPVDEPQLVAVSACSIDAATGRMLFEKNIDEKRPVASTQKLLTALLIAESGNLDEKIAVEHSDEEVQPRNLWITYGSSYEKGKLLEMMLVRSFNDVTKCLARHHAGSQARFAELMNEKAKQLGMTNSNFVTAHGLPAEGQHSTARDMMILALAAWENETIRRMVGIKETTFTYEGAKTIPVKNSNELLHDYAECVGMKTGYTSAAGRCLIAAATRGERTILAVILGSTMEDVWSDAETLLLWSLDQ